MKNWTKKGPNGLDIKAFPCKMVISLFIKLFNNNLFDRINYKTNTWMDWEGLTRDSR